MQKYNVQIVIGNTKFVLTGATAFEVTEGSEKPKIQHRAPIGGKTIKSEKGSDSEMVIHEIDKGE